MGPASFAFLGVVFDDLGVDQAVAHLLARPAGEPFAYVVTPNVDHLVNLADDFALAAFYRDAWLTTCDSRILRHLARHAGHDLSLCPGSDLTPALLDRLGPGDTINIIGFTSEGAERLRKRYPGITIRQHLPPLGLRINVAAQEAIVNFVAANPARFTFLAVGSPQQEAVAHRIAASGRAVGVGLCIGASLEFVTGVKKRASRWMQRLSLEWAFRLSTEPGRLWTRYLVRGPRIFPLYLKWRRRHG